MPEEGGKELPLDVLIQNLWKDELRKLKNKKKTIESLSSDPPPTVCNGREELPLTEED